jgi:hypothetical protein
MASTLTIHVRGDLLPVYCTIVFKPSEGKLIGCVDEPLTAVARIF